MIPIEGQPVLTAAEMRAAEEAVIATGVSVDTLMDRAGTRIAHAVRRLAGANAILILCGPGNNGGDGYVAARVLADLGATVRVAALSEPRNDAAKAARAGWCGPVGGDDAAAVRRDAQPAKPATGVTDRQDDAVRPRSLFDRAIGHERGVALRTRDMHRRLRVVATLRRIRSARLLLPAGCERERKKGHNILRSFRYPRRHGFRLRLRDA